MDKLKGVAKGGWKPSGDRPIHRDSWKSDLKGMATGKKNDPYAYARDHHSAPLSSLKDPDSFGPPPKHKEFYPNAGGASNSPQEPSGGWGSKVPTPSNRPDYGQQQQQQQQPVEQEAPPPPVPYRTDTTGLRTDHLPKPPTRRLNESPPVPPRNGHSVPSAPSSGQHRQQTVPAPTLPPRMNDHPDEHTPPPPPPYSEATQPVANPAIINAGAASRLTRAGVSVPGLDIGTQAGHDSPQSPASASNVSELQQRFAKMNSGSQVQPSSPTSGTSESLAAVAAHKKPPPPPPPKKSHLVIDDHGSHLGSVQNAGSLPPPIPQSSKPKPT